MTRPLVFLAYKAMVLAMVIMQSLGIISTPSTATPVVVDDSANISFVVWGDCQVSNYLYKREANFKAACEDLSNTQGKLDALMIVGDIAENGMESEYAVVSENLNRATDVFDNFIVAEGNHDIRLKAYKLQNKRFEKFNDSVGNSIQMTEGRYNYSTEIKGYKFIVVGSDKTVFEESYISPAQLEWLDNEIASTQQSGKPCFVIIHQPLKNTHGLPTTWGAPDSLDLGSIGEQSSEIRAIFEKYNNVIMISGHLHTGTGKYSYEDYGSFKSVNVQTVCANNANGYDADGQGYVFSVYDNKIVAKARVFATGEWVDESVENAVIEIPLS